MATTGRNALARTRRAERQRGVVADAGGEQLWALLLFARSASRRDALQGLWIEEQREAVQQGRLPNPAIPPMALKLLDTTSYLTLLRDGRRDHARPTNFAFDFTTWSRPEVDAFRRMGDLGCSFSADEEEAVVSVASRIDLLMDGADRTWEDDLRLMAIIAGGPEVGGAHGR
jgi:hypothetical protein